MLKNDSDRLFITTNFRCPEGEKSKKKYKKKKGWGGERETDRPAKVRVGRSDWHPNHKLTLNLSGW